MKQGNIYAYNKNNTESRIKIEKKVTQRKRKNKANIVETYKPIAKRYVKKIKLSILY